jgi:hypothetical protein
MGSIENLRRVPHGIALPLTIDKSIKQFVGQHQSGVKTFIVVKRDWFFEMYFTSLIKVL